MAASLLMFAGCPAEENPEQAVTANSTNDDSQAVQQATRTPDHLTDSSGDAALPSLQARLDETRTASGAPPEVLDAIRRQNKALVEQDLLEQAVGFGKPAPDFTLEALKGNPVNLAETYAAGPVVLVFFRGGW